MDPPAISVTMFAMFEPVTGGGLELGPTLNVTPLALLMGSQKFLPSSKLGFRKYAIRPSPFSNDRARNH
jgi:hypothetical protein